MLPILFNWIRHAKEPAKQNKNIRKNLSISIEITKYVVDYQNSSFPVENDRN